MRKILTNDFFDRNPLIVARELLGKFLVRRIEADPSTGVRAREIALMITETESYGGPQDLASHARYGRTLRTAPMFGPPGTIYVYFTYGMHWMLNIACEREGKPSAVLIRAAGDVSGPARLTKFLHVDKTFTGKALGKKNRMWVEDRGVKVKTKEIKKTPRVGIAYAGTYVHKPWRFVLTARAKVEE